MHPPPFFINSIEQLLKSDGILRSRWVVRYTQGHFTTNAVLGGIWRSWSAKGGHWLEVTWPGADPAGLAVTSSLHSSWRPALSLPTSAPEAPWVGVPVHRGVQSLLSSPSLRPLGAHLKHLRLHQLLIAISHVTPTLCAPLLPPRTPPIHWPLVCLSPWPAASAGARPAGSRLRFLSAHSTEGLARGGNQEHLLRQHTRCRSEAHAGATSPHAQPPGRFRTGLGRPAPAPVPVPTGAALTVRDHGGLGFLRAEPPEVK